MLHFDIKLNYDSIGSVYIRRTHALRADLVSLYEYEVVLNGVTYAGHVHHHYDDGALALIAKVLEQVETQKRGESP